MFVLKVILFYVALLCLTVPPFACAAYLSQTPEEQKTKFPWNAMRRIFVAGVALLTAAIVLVIFA